MSDEDGRGAIILVVEDVEETRDGIEGLLKAPDLIRTAWSDRSHLLWMSDALQHGLQTAPPTTKSNTVFGDYLPSRNSLKAAAG